MKTLSNHISEGLEAAENDTPIVENLVDDTNNDKVDENGNPITEDNNEDLDNDNVNESLVNEGLTDLISSLSSDETAMLMGVVGTLGIAVTGATYEKIVDKLEKSNNSVAKKVIAKLQEWGKAAAGASK